jgi:hypothetical protein
VSATSILPNLVATSPAHAKPNFCAARTKLSVYVYFGQLNLAFNLPLGLVNAEVDISLPCAEDEWQAVSDLEWAQTRTTARAGGARISFTQSLDAFLGTHSPDLGIWSPFGVLVMLHAILQEVWQIRRYAPSSTVSEQLRSLEQALQK